MNPPHSLEETYVFTGRTVYYFIEQMDTELLDKNSKTFHGYCHIFCLTIVNNLHLSETTQVIFILFFVLGHLHLDLDNAVKASLC